MKSMLQKSRKGNAWAWLVLACLAAIVLAQGILLKWQPVDDAYVAFRYARHLVQGDGLVFNVGERVEGYTDFLWVILLAGASRLGFDLPKASVGLGVAFSFGGLWLTWLLAEQVAKERRWPERAAWLAPVLLAFYPGWGYWAFGGLEGPLLTFLVVAFMLLAFDRSASWRRLIAAGLVGGLAAMTRWEVVLFWPIAAGVHLWDPARSMAERLRRVAVLVCVMGCAFGIYFLWRYHYYGQLLPNTYWAKVGGALRGRLVRGIAYSTEWAVAWLAPMTVVTWVLRGRQVLSSALLACLVVFGAYVTWTGGDFFPWLRFYLPVLPVTAILLADAVVALAAGLSLHAPWKWSLAALGAATAAVVGGAAMRLDIQKATQHRQYVADWKQVGLWASKHLPPQYSVALAPVGAVAFYGQQPVLDVLGLTDFETAHFGQIDPSEGPGHQKSNIRSLIRRRPEVVLGQAYLFPRPPTEAEAAEGSARKALKALYALPEFDKLYRYEVQPVGSRYLPLWIRRDLPSIASGEEPSCSAAVHSAR